VIRRTVICLGLSQLISWGVSYYLIGVFGEAIAAEFGWGRDVVYGGFALGLLVMGLASPMTGRLIDRHGGRKVMRRPRALSRPHELLSCMDLPRRRDASDAL
jgi:MFS family permease